MDLEELSRAGGGGAIVRGDGAVEIEDIAFDSRRVGAGALFVCVSGASSDGHDFAAAAVDAGAVALVVERELEVDVPQLLVEDARAVMGSLAARFFGEPSRELLTIAVTGTNGKTTTAFLARSILEAAGTRCGLLGTVAQVVGGRKEPVERTTPEAIDLQRTLRRMLDAGDGACVMEVSSHALVLGRANAIDFDAAAFTNLTQDHLDFHADMEDYFAAKRALFAPPSGAGARAPKSAAVNVDDPFGARLADELGALGEPPVTGFSAAGSESADLSARDVSFDASGTRFVLHGAGDPRPVRLRLPGHFNVENALAALAATMAAGIDPDVAVAALAVAQPVPGRMEPVSREGSPAPFAVLVDYAHTPDSLLNVLTAARRLTAGRLICVFGCGGDRDPLKRPLMGRAVHELADAAVVTSDNPRSERPEAIIEQVLEGMSSTGGAEAHVEVDRRAAIALAFGLAQAGDLVVIAGKGHEEGQEFAGGEKHPFDDREVAREELGKLPVAASAPAGPTS